LVFRHYYRFLPKVVSVKVPMENDLNFVWITEIFEERPNDVIYC
jgi:hypothetical protein